MESEEFRYRRLQVIDKRVQRLGLACNFGIDATGVEWALGEGGMQYVFWTPRQKVATEVLRRALKRDRDRYAVATGPTTALWSGNLRRYVDKVRTTLDIDQIDVLQILPQLAPRGRDPDGPGEPGAAAREPRGPRQRTALGRGNGDVPGAGATGQGERLQLDLIQPNYGCQA